MKRKKYSLAGNILFYYKKLYACSPAVVWQQALYVGSGILLPLFTIYLPKITIDFVQRKASVMELVFWLGGFILLSAVCSGVSGWADRSSYMERLNVRTLLVYEAFRKFLRIGYRYTEDGDCRKKYYAAQQTNYGGDDSVPMTFWAYLPDLVIQVVCFALYSGVIGSLHPAVLILLLVISGINYGLGEMERRYRDRMQEKREDLDRKFWEVHSRCRDTAAAKDIRIFGLAGWLTEKMEGLVNAVQRLERQISVRKLWRENVGHILNALRDFCAYAYLVSAAFRRQIGAGDFVLYLGAITGFGNFLNQMIGAMQILGQNSDRACRYREFCALPEEDLEEGEKRAIVLSDAPSIDFEDVTFGYEEGKEILSHFNLHIRPGEHIALVGENGAGKTTLIKLLAGFYKPDAGTIRIDGVDAEEIPRRERYRYFGAVFQESRVFPFTVGENLACTTGEKVDAMRAREALMRAGIGESFRQKGIGLDSRMTKHFLEEGIELSGGQQQRFMLARALYRDAQVLLLDEPTAALDPIAESEIYDAYARMTAGKTAIFVSHRLASTRFSDRILLLHQGKIIESGAHEELLVKNGAYAAMFALQASYYREGTEGSEEDGNG